MATHDVTIKTEFIEDVGGHPHISHMGQGKGTITHDCLSTNEIERVALPEYFSGMNYDTDDDDVDTTIHAASQHRATARQRYLPELASLDAGQMGSLVKTLLEVQIKREAESIEFAVEANDTPKIWTVLTQQINAVENLTLVGEPEVETELADTSVPFGNKILVGGNDIDAGLLDQPLTANVLAAETQETDGRNADFTETVAKPDVETELADTSIPLGNRFLRGEKTLTPSSPTSLLLPTT